MQLQVASFLLWELIGSQQDDWGIGLQLHLCMTKATNELTCYIIGSADCCSVGFMAREYAAGDNGPLLDVTIIEIVRVFTPDSKSRYLCCLYHHNCGYA